MTDLNEHNEPTPCTEPMWECPACGFKDRADYDAWVERQAERAAATAPSGLLEAVQR